MSKTVRGFRDIYGQEAEKIKYILDVCIEEGKKLGCEYLIMPSVEYVSLFQRSIGDSDIVKKEMLKIERPMNEPEPRALRGEGTAQAVRNIIERGAIEDRVMYDGSFFRDERAQKGRYKEFRQFGAEFFSAREGKYEEFDMFRLINNIFTRLGIQYKIKINNIGNAIERKNYENQLAEYVRNNLDKYSEDSKERLKSGAILRILDSKIDSKINANAPKMSNCVSSDIIDFFKTLNIQYEIDSYLVRGLDYYNGNVFEIISSNYNVDSCHVALGGGGRYDSLPRQIGSKVINKSCGFGLGVDRMATCIQYEYPSLPYMKVIMYNDDIQKLVKVYKEYEKDYNIITVKANEKISKDCRFTKIIEIK